MIRTDRRLRLCVALLAANLVFIWGNSLLPGHLSGAFSDWVKSLLAQLIPGLSTGASGGGLIRKLAHFTEFAMLGLLLRWLVGMLQKPWVWSLGAGFLAACVDETIQRFVPGRGPGVKDVLIDTCGVAAGILLLWLGHTVSKKRKKQYPLEEM